MKNMLLHSHMQQTKEQEKAGLTFRLVPITNDSAYLVGEYDLGTGKLVMCTKTVKDELQSIPKMSPTGEYVPVKNPKPNTPGIELERRLLPEIFEIHIENNDAIMEFIDTVAINSDTFNYKALLNIPYGIDNKAKEIIVPENYDAKEKKSKLVTLS